MYPSHWCCKIRLFCLHFDVLQPWLSIIAVKIVLLEWCLYSPKTRKVSEKWWHPWSVCWFFFFPPLLGVERILLRSVQTTAAMHNAPPCFLVWIGLTQHVKTNGKMRGENLCPSLLPFSSLALSLCVAKYPCRLHSLGIIIGFKRALF